MGQYHRLNTSPFNVYSTCAAYKKKSDSTCSLDAIANAPSKDDSTRLLGAIANTSSKRR